MRSMTGFGQAAKETERFRVTVTVRGVNHRYLDLSLRLREEHRRLEPALRELVAGRQERGRVELSVDVEALGARAFEVEIDDSLVSSLHALGQKLAARDLISGQQLELGDLLKIPELVQLRARDPEWTDEDRALWLEVVAAALDECVAARETEGKALYEILAERREGLAELVARLSERRAALPEEMVRHLKQRISELLGEALDKDRVAQEAALLVERSDVAEELDRLRSHLDHFRSIMNQGGSVGKRLDFLSQEIFRELNTVGSKCRDSEMIRWVLDAKVLCEQIREQVQNVE